MIEYTSYCRCMFVVGVRILILGLVWLSYLKYEVTNGYRKRNDMCMYGISYARS